MKRCPFCAEDIQDEAIKCRHCGSMLVAAQPREKGRVTVIGYLGIVIGVLMIVVGVLMLGSGGSDAFGSYITLMMGFLFVIGSYQGARRPPRS
jgi:predicted nucleic acid-binding Zn ribbon protein